MHIFDGPRQRVCMGFVASAVFFVATSTHIAADDASQRYTLQYKFLAAKNVAYSVENTSEVELHQGGAEQHIEHSELTDKHYKVVSTDLNGSCVLELSIDRVRMSAAVDDGEAIKFDSQETKDAPPEFEGITDTIGQPHIRVKVSPVGEVLSVQQLPEEKEQPVTAKNAGKLDVLVRLPDEPVAIGDIWKERFEDEIIVDEQLRKAVTIQRTYTLKSVDGNRATIQLETSVITPIREPEQEAQLIQKTPSGTIVFDIERGLLLSRETSLDRKVVGFSGPNSFIRNITTRHERYVESESTGPIQQARDVKGIQR